MRSITNMFTEKEALYIFQVFNNLEFKYNMIAPVDTLYEKVRLTYEFEGALFLSEYDVNNLLKKLKSLSDPQALAVINSIIYFKNIVKEQGPVADIKELSMVKGKKKSKNWYINYYTVNDGEHKRAILNDCNKSLRSKLKKILQDSCKPNGVDTLLWNDDIVYNLQTKVDDKGFEAHLSFYSKEQNHTKFPILSVSGSNDKIDKYDSMYEYANAAQSIMELPGYLSLIQIEYPYVVVYTEPSSLFYIDILPEEQKKLEMAYTFCCVSGRLITLKL